MKKWRDMVVQFMKANPAEPRRASEIVREMLDKDFGGLKEYFAKRGGNDSSERKKEVLAALASRITSESKRGEYPEEFRAIGSPREYYWAEKDGNEESEEGEQEAQEKSEEERQREEHLYNPLREYLKNDLCVRSVFIPAQQSKQDGLGGRKWLYPDIVGIEDLFLNWEDEIKELSKNVVNKKAKKKVRFWSLEVKLSLNRNNTRESFFQAVVNSSWANFGYLAGIIEDDVDKIITELRRLADLYGIGVIAINKDDYSANSIIIPARERDEIDMSTCNRLASTNDKFAEYVQQVNRLHEGSYDSDFWQIPKDES